VIDYSKLPKEKYQKPSAPILLKEEKEEALKFGQSLDSKKVKDHIGDVDLENTCKVFSKAVMKHVQFSKGELLVDDLVSESQDIPQFSYEFGTDLKIDLEEI